MCVRWHLSAHRATQWTNPSNTFLCMKHVWNVQAKTCQINERTRLPVWLCVECCPPSPPCHVFRLCVCVRSSLSLFPNIQLNGALYVVYTTHILTHIFDSVEHEAMVTNDRSVLLLLVIYILCSLRFCFSHCCLWHNERIEYFLLMVFAHIHFRNRNNNTLTVPWVRECILCVRKSFKSNKMEINKIDRPKIPYCFWFFFFCLSCVCSCCWRRFSIAQCFVLQ